MKVGKHKKEERLSALAAEQKRAEQEIVQAAEKAAQAPKGGMARAPRITQ